MAWIEVVRPEDAEGELASVYGDIVKKRGNLANVYQIHSLNPQSLRDHLQTYLTLMFGPSPLSRRERETIAVAVSSANRCSYCVAHHSDPLARLSKDEDFPKEVIEGAPSLTDRERALVEHAAKVTRQPSGVDEADIAALRDVGLSDREILDATLVTAYFNFVNRIVLTLGVELEG